MLRKILLIVAIVAALAAAIVNFTVVRQKIGQLTDDRNSQRSQKEEFNRELNVTNKLLVVTQKSLADTKTQLADSEAQRTKLSKDLDVANTQISDLNGKLAKTTQERDNAQDQLAAYKATGKTAQEVLNMDKVLKKAQIALDVANQEDALLARDVKRLQNQLYEIIGSNVVVQLPATLHGTVMAVDPKWNFVVLNVGADQGVLQDGEMLLSRDGKLVAKVIVRSVQKDRCIANVVPGWQLGDVIEGDMATPAHPSQS